MTDKEIKEWAKEQITEINADIELSLLQLQEAIFPQPFPKEFFKSTYYKTKGLAWTRLSDAQYYSNILAALSDYKGRLEGASYDIPHLQGMTNETLQRDKKMALAHLEQNEDDANPNLWHA